MLTLEKKLKERIVTMYAFGISISDISKKLKMDEGEVRRYIEPTGLSKIA